MKAPGLNLIITALNRKARLYCCYEKFTLHCACNEVCSFVPSATSRPDYTQSALALTGLNMQQLNFDDVLTRMVEQNPRYHRDAYLFLREALDFTQKVIAKSNKNRGRDGSHITGQELLNGIREYALAIYGPMTMTVFDEWGITSCEDFGQMVFLMIENNLLRKTDQDRPEDFKNGFSFEEAFRKPFLPSGKPAPVAVAPEPSKVEQN